MIPRASPGKGDSCSRSESSSTITYGVLVGFAVRLGKGSILALAIRVHLGTAFNLIYEPQIGVVFPNG